VLADRIAEARRIIEVQQARIMGLQTSGQFPIDAESTLRVRVSSLLHLLVHVEKLQEGRWPKKPLTKY
jgi:hypothetical protein